MTGELLQGYLPDPFIEFEVPESWKIQKRQGKVRDILDKGDAQLALITTDRKSAFDRVLGSVPCTGEVNNRISAFWFTVFNKEGFRNHMISAPDPNVMIVRKAAEPLGVEVVVDEPVITPTTKADVGHDERLTCQEVVDRGLAAPDVWNQVQTSALSMFKKAQDIALARGLVLMDTKMEFGLDGNGEPMVIDELFTGDSSRYVLASTYQQKVESGQELDHMDKEFLRLNYRKATGYRGDGEAPPIPDLLIAQTADRYIRLHDMLTGTAFQMSRERPQERIEQNLIPWIYPH
ncbi:MAG: Phosphoribosylaminoimidazole-succinocarboxamide synthase [Candidatus Levybacteria bacterium GW2011_GWA2_40_16]|nr:MAG: Phosphoribosylaminoimidazole-succinocarboxamide synthase [Candidatus Levybacteria bacterium GW2011_GWA2_40_16]